MSVLPVLNVTPTSEAVSVIRRTVAPWGVVAITRPMSPPLATTGMPDQDAAVAALGDTHGGREVGGRERRDLCRHVGRAPTKGTLSPVVSCWS